MTSTITFNEPDLLAEKANVQAAIDQIADDVPDEVLDAKRVTDAAIAAKQRELGSLIDQRNRIDEAFQVTQREAAERSAYAQDRRIKREAENAVATNERLLDVLDDAQDHLQAAFAKIIEARQLLPVAQASVNALELPSSFSLEAFNRRLSEWIADELSRAWPVGAAPLGAYVKWQRPPNFDPSKPRTRWRHREMDEQRHADIERLVAMIEEREHIR